MKVCKYWKPDLDAVCFFKWENCTETCHVEH
jgi:hypothetical protein